ncbi:MAG: hypothetical protein V7784_20950 [Oceanospirillaceae bacterium]
MIYFSAVLIPTLLQCLFVFLVIEMNTGNGSWLGLGALLIGIFAIPATSIVNFIYAKSNKNIKASIVIAKCFLISFLMPIIILLMMVF